MSRVPVLPFVPRGLSKENAALYVGLPVATFAKLVADGRMPAPRSIEGHEVWDRNALDRSFDALESSPAARGARPAGAGGVLTPAKIAERWGCSDQHVRNLINNGSLPSFSLGGKLVRVKLADLEAFEAATVDR